MAGASSSSSYRKGFWEKGLVDFKPCRKWVRTIIHIFICNLLSMRMSCWFLELVCSCSYSTVDPTRSLFLHWASFWAFCNQWIDFSCWEKRTWTLRSTCEEFRLQGCCRWWALRIIKWSTTIKGLGCQCPLVFQKRCRTGWWWVFYNKPLVGKYCVLWSFLWWWIPWGAIIACYP